MGIGYALTGLSRTLWLAAAALVFASLVNMVYYVPLISVTQREAPDRIRGRVMSTRFLVVQVGLLAGMATAGPLGDRLGAPLVFLTAGTLLVVSAVLGAAFRNLRSVELREEPATPTLTATASA